MNIQLSEIRDRLGKDDLPYINAKITPLISSAKGALLASIGFKEGDTIPTRSADEFEAVSDTYIVEYIRGSLEQIDNEKSLSIIAVQAEALLSDDDETNVINEEDGADG